MIRTVSHHPRPFGSSDPVRPPDCPCLPGRPSRFDRPLPPAQARKRSRAWEGFLTLPYGGIKMAVAMLGAVAGAMGFIFTGGQSDGR